MEAIQNAILQSFESLRIHDGMLFDCPIEIEAPYDSRKLHEVCINHRLALHLERSIIPLLNGDEFFVDIEFNREGGNFKKIKAEGREERVRPDIIIHNRRSGDNKKNFLVVECKKKNANEDKINADVKKLEAFIQDPKYQYEYGLQVTYDDKNITALLLFSLDGEVKKVPLSLHYDQSTTT